MYKQFRPTDPVFRVLSALESREGMLLRAYPLDAQVETLTIDGRSVIATSLGCLGVEDREPFFFHLYNPSRFRVAVRVTLDGTDALTGAVADFAAGPKLLLEPGKTSELRAWREGPRGGAGYIFTTLGKSVVKHTHGDLRAAMTLGLAVWFDEAEEEREDLFKSSLAAEMDAFSYGASAPLESRAPFPAAEEAHPLRNGKRSAMGVGAGAFTAQSFREVEGLRRPVLRNLFTLRYLHVDDLERECRLRGITAPPRPAVPPAVVTAGFPGASPAASYVSLGGTPRQGPPSPRLKFDRFA